MLAEKGKDRDSRRDVRKDSQTGGDFVRKNRDEQLNGMKNKQSHITDDNKRDNSPRNASKQNLNRQGASRGNAGKQSTGGQVAVGGNARRQDTRPASSYIRPNSSGQRMNIREQTPKMRRSAREVKKINPDMPEIKRTAKRAQGYRIKKKKKRDTRLILARGLVFLLVFLIMCGIFAGLLVLDLKKTDESKYSRIKLFMGLDRTEIEGINVDVAKYVQGEIMYVNLTAIATEFGFVTTGTRDEMRYITDLKSGENVRLMPDSDVVSVNGNSVKLEAKTFYDGNSIFVPVSFVKEYINGIDIRFDEEKSYLYVLRGNEMNDDGKYIKSDISFKLKPVVSEEVIDENSLSQAIKDRTYFMSITPPATAG